MADDVQNLSVRIRLPAYSLAVGLLLFDLGITSYLIASIACLILITGWLNTFNFMDGINGISTVYATVLLISIWFIIPDVYSPILFSVLIAIGVFSVLNFRKKAICFAGDIGSISLALITAWFFLLTWQSENTPFYLLLFPALYAIDSVWTIIQRLFKGENIFEAHRSHLYQLLANENKMDHRAVATIYGVIQTIINIVAITYISTLPFAFQILAVSMFYLLLSGIYLMSKNSVSSKFITSS